jgi:hypothetical protein
MIGQSFVFGGIAGGGGPIDLQYLIVGGGAIGGLGVSNISSHPVHANGWEGGGGGAGAAIVATTTFGKGTVYTITVGGSDTDSTIVGDDITTITAATGGKGGGNENQPSGKYSGWVTQGNTQGSDKNGACGGGGGTSLSSSGHFGTGSVGSRGGRWYRSSDSQPRRGAGGGGMGAVGGDNVTPGNNGGAGMTVSLFTDSTATTAGIGQVSSGSVYFSGGGGGAIRSFTKGYGGLGGGGNGASYGFSYGSNGSTNTGGAGGGSAGNNAYSIQGPYYGGSGVVVFKVPTADYSGIVTGSPTTVVEGSNTMLIFKGSGTYTP